MDKELANSKALIKYQSEINKSQITGSSGGTAKSAATSAGSAIAGGGIARSYSSGGTKIPQNYEVNTAYYQGAKNPDAAKYGTFSNGYQPKGISGHGKLKKTGDTIGFTTKTLSGQKQSVTQNIWEADDGTLWYWEGRENKYLSINNK